MGRTRVCEACGVPLIFSRDMTWHRNGTITEAKDLSHRMIFFESDNIDRIFQKIENAIGVSIERIVVESQRRSTKEYLENLIPKNARKLLALFAPGLITRRMAEIALVYGYGNVEVLEMRIRRLRSRATSDDKLVLRISNPYSVYRFCGDNLGGMEAITGRACTVRRESLDATTMRLELIVGQHPVELEERLKKREYTQKPGNLDLARCSSCGVPLGLAQCRWDLDNGIITHLPTGRRMAFFGPASLDAAFGDLESELGETIPETVIDAQREYARENLSREDWRVFSSSPGENLAVRGLGMLTHLEVGDRQLEATIQNPCVHLWIVGIIQGLFEIGTGHEETRREWSLSSDGELAIRITA